MFKLSRGDCLDLLAELPDASVDLVLTDPPYGTTACKWDSVIPLDLMWVELKRVTKPRAAIVLFGAEPFTSALISSNYLMFKYTWIWEKTIGTNPMGLRYQPFRKHEIIAVFYWKAPIYHPQMETGAPYTDRARPAGLNHCSYSGGMKKEITNLGTRYPSSVQKFSNGNWGSVHPTQKPVDLMEYMVRTYSDPGDVVLDFTMGSGTTGVACANLDRSFVGFELDDDYFDIARNRISRALLDRIEVKRRKEN